MECHGAQVGDRAYSGGVSIPKRWDKARKSLNTPGSSGAGGGKHERASTPQDRAGAGGSGGRDFSRLVAS